MITASEVQQVEAKRRNMKKETYKHILGIFDKKIRNAVNLGFSSVKLEIPIFVWGFPTYTISSAMPYLRRQLEKLGYTVQDGDNLFIVTWGRKKMASENTAAADEEGLPSLVNLRKIAKKITQQTRNGGNR
jgi:Family of unknown function (DUF5759)